MKEGEREKRGTRSDEVEVEGRRTESVFLFFFLGALLITRGNDAKRRELVSAYSGQRKRRI